MNTAELARYVGVDPATIRNWLAKGWIEQPEIMDGHKFWTTDQARKIVEWRHASLQSTKKKRNKI